MSNVQFTAITTDEGQQFITVLVDGRLQPPVDDTHPNFGKIKEICATALGGEDVDTEHLLSLFDVEQTIREQFERLSDRVSVKNGVITLDGDPVHGTLQDQILAFLDAGEDFAPLVNFYEKLLTNPLGDVREGLYTWIQGQKAEGNFTITPEGDILGYKGVMKATPEWRTDYEVVYVPSRRGEGIVNGRDVSASEYIEQVPGDTVEMPRSRVLHEPSRECGDGLHIGTWAYAKGFGDGSTMLVKFSPRDIVSLPDGNSSWKLRVCRYDVIDLVDEPLEVPVYQTETPSGDVNVTVSVDIDLTLPAQWQDADGQGFDVGDRVADSDGDEGVVTGSDSGGDPVVKYDEAIYGEEGQYAHSLRRVHGKGGPTSQEAKGNGRSPAQDEKGRFSNGRPGSNRDSSTGRFV